jgi:hypothetical protein
MPPLVNTVGKKYITIKLPIIETDKLIDYLPYYSYFFIGRGFYQYRI